MATRTPVVTYNFTGDADGAFPAGFTDLNGVDGQVRVVTNKFHNDFGNVADARSTSTFTDDQYFSFVVSGFSGGNINDQVGGCLRLGTGVHGGTGVNGYRVKVVDDPGNSGNRFTQLFKVVNDTETQLGSNVNSAWANGDTCEGEIFGTSITVFRNGVSIITQTDATHSTGKPGICARQGGNATMRGDDAELGNLTASAPPPAELMAGSKVFVFP